MRLLLLLLILLLPVSVFAQDAVDLQRRLELAEQMHEFRPAREQVDHAIDSVAARLPASDQESFKSTMGNILNYKAIERVSIDAMAETFTEAELEAMVAYYKQPEARSVSDKYDEYYARVGPEIVKMIDAAMMRMKLGDAP